MRTLIALILIALAFGAAQFTGSVLSSAEIIRRGAQPDPRWASGPSLEEACRALEGDPANCVEEVTSATD